MGLINTKVSKMVTSEKGRRETPWGGIIPGSVTVNEMFVNLGGGSLILSYSE